MYLFAVVAPTTFLEGDLTVNYNFFDDDKKPKKEFVPVAPGSFESAAIVLLTDGRRTTGVETQEAAMMAANHGVRVYSVGLGTVDGEVAGIYKAVARQVAVSIAAKNRDFSSRFPSITISKDT